jgi:predicted RNA-binding Zn-ribbon protein involved in translation (DUF1610 family)
VVDIVFCSSCGKELSEDAYFCPNCGVRTRMGVEVGAGGPWEEVREAFGRMGEELEKAFETAGREIEKAFKTAKEEIKEATSKEQVVCPDCGEKNASSAKFCYKCGRKLD